jgi:hypothetical protein
LNESLNFVPGSLHETSGGYTRLMINLLMMGIFL